jgi:hypothetical protein
MLDHCQFVVSSNARWKTTKIEFQMPNKTKIVLQSEKEAQNTILIVLKNYYFFSRLYCEGSLGLAQAVMSGDMLSRELPIALSFFDDVIETYELNVNQTHSVQESGKQKVEIPEAGNNILQLDSSFFEYFLGSSMNFSFSTVENIISELDIQEGENVLEIGGGLVKWEIFLRA